MQERVSKLQVFFMTLTCALIVGNLYYNQPLLGVLSRFFQVSETEASLIPTLTLIGYAFGIFLLVPIGDMINARKLIQASMFISGCLALLLTLSPNLTVFLIISCVLGFANVGQSVLIPFSANLAAPAERGKVVGLVLSGILIGSLSARTMAGIITQYFGWKAVFIFAGCVSIFLSLITPLLLPNATPHFKGSYKSLLRSIFEIFKDFPTIREASLMGAILFGSFSAFWTVLTFLLEGEPFFFEPKIIGLFGALGLIGALAAPLAGKYLDTKGAATTIRLGLYCAMAAFAILGFSSNWVIGLVIGVLFLDLGIQVAHISNQSRIFNYKPEARSRLNTIYIFFYFVGGSAGSYIGSILWSLGKWPAVCAGGFIACLTAFLVFRRGVESKKQPLS